MPLKYYQPQVYGVQHQQLLQVPRVGVLPRHFVSPQVYGGSSQVRILRKRYTLMSTFFSWYFLAQEVSRVKSIGCWILTSPNLHSSNGLQHGRPDSLLICTVKIDFEGGRKVVLQTRIFFWLETTLKITFNGAGCLASHAGDHWSNEGLAMLIFNSLYS